MHPLQADFFPCARQWTEWNEFSKHCMADKHTNHITTNGICGYIFHAVLWKFIPLCPASVFLLPEYLRSLHTLAVTSGVQKAGGCEDLAPDSKYNKGQAELQPAGTRGVPGVGDRERIPPLDFLTFLASVLFNVLICAT